MLSIRGGRKKSILRCIAILSSTILSLFFFSAYGVRARDAAGFIAQNLHCETRAHCLTVCASTRRVLL